METASGNPAIKLVIEFTKPFSDAVGTREMEFPFHGSTVSDLLQDLSRGYPKMGKLVRTETGEWTEFIIIFVNDKPISSLKGMDTILSDGDRIFFLFPISGG